MALRAVPRRFTPRTVRRALWLSLLMGVIGAAALTIALLPSADPPWQPAPVTAAGGEVPPAEPRPARLELTAAVRHELLQTAQSFVGSSVGRDHPERSWTLVHPVLRQGLTRAEWKTGNIPVVPFPVAHAVGWSIDEATERQVLMEVVLIPESNSGLLAKTFVMELRPARVPHHWLVASWVPLGVSGAQMSMDAEARGANAVPYHRHNLSGAWLFVPLFLLSLTIVAPAFVFALDALRGRRAALEYQRTRSGSSSSSSPS
jgi:hypothetical protein